MAITLRSAKGTALTSAEIDANFTTLDTLKAPIASPTLTGVVTLPNQSVALSGTVLPNIRPSLNLDFANSKRLDPRITFSRLSTATYYDGQTTAMAEQNLVLQSQNFVWSTQSATATAGQIDPSGGAGASLITQTAQAAYSAYSNTANPPANLTETFSIYLYGVAGTTVKIGVGNTVNQDIGTTVTLTASWARYSVSGTFNSTVSTTSRIYVGMDAATTATSVYVAFPQLEQRSSATAYTPTTTAAITNYIPVLMTAPAGVARFDHDPISGKSLGLLIEEQRTNLLTYSQDFSNAVWTLTNATLTAAATIAPDGTQTAFNLVSNTSTGLQAIAETVTKAASAIAYTGSVYFKTNQYTYSWLQISDGAGNGAIVYFNLTTGAISTAVASVGTAFTTLSATITLIGNNWYRCTITGTSNTATSLVTQFGSSTNGTSNSFTGNGYSGIYIWGAQVEAGSFATSYIPTTSGSATRSADQASMTGVNFSSWYNQSQGSFYCEFDVIGYGAASSNRLFALTDVGLNTIRHVYETSTGLVGTANPNIAVSATLIGVSNKVVYSFDNITTYMRLNNIATAPNPYTSVSPISTLNIGNLNGDRQCNGHIKKLSYYPKALTATELQALTS